MKLPVDIPGQRDGIAIVDVGPPDGQRPLYVIVGVEHTWTGLPHEARALAYALLGAADAAQFPSVEVERS